MSTTTTGQIGFAGKMILALENPPWDRLYRAAIGYFILPIYYSMMEGHEAPWKLGVFFLAVLASLRIVPGMIRRVLPFSRAVKSIWAERRAMAKRYDSYQWRKLFGIGVGLLVYVPRNFQYPAFYLALACLIAGLAGDVFWLKHKRLLLTQSPVTTA